MDDDKYERCVQKKKKKKHQRIETSMYEEAKLNQYLQKIVSTNKSNQANRRESIIPHQIIIRNHYHAWNYTPE